MKLSKLWLLHLICALLPLRSVSLLARGILHLTTFRTPSPESSPPREAFFWQSRSPVFHCHVPETHHAPFLCTLALSGAAGSQILGITQFATLCSMYSLQGPPAAHFTFPFNGAQFHFFIGSRELACKRCHPGLSLHTSCGCPVGPHLLFVSRPLQWSPLCL